MREELEESNYERETFREELSKLRDDYKQKQEEVAQFKATLLEMRVHQGANIIRCEQMIKSS
jgi:uncharacterized protein (DUF3084 family)